MLAPHENRIAAAQGYIDALVSHDADAVPFAAGCTRIKVKFTPLLQRSLRM